MYTWKRRGRAGRGRGEKDNCGSENSWISGGLPSISRRRRRGEKKGEGESGQRREVQSKSTLESTAKSESEIRSRSRAGVDIAPRISPRVSRPGHRRSILHSASHGWGEIYAVMTEDDDNADDVDFPDTLVSTRVSWKSPSSALSSSSVIAAFART